MDWKYYNHAMVPDCPPHEDVDITAVENGSVWQGSKALLARWTSDYDCQYETEWWYTIKDTPFDAMELKSSRRRDINKARRFFEVKQISPAEYAEELFHIQVSAFEAYPKKYRPTVEHDSFVQSISEWSGYMFGAFYIDPDADENGKLCGYNMVSRRGDTCLHYGTHKVIPAYENKAVNFALVDGVLAFFNEELRQGHYISNGQRSTNHETAFNNLLERNFNFRKSYCKLNVVYRPSVRWLIPILYLFRKPLKKLDKIGFIHLINAVLLMEKIKRKCKDKNV